MHAALVRAGSLLGLINKTDDLLVGSFAIPRVADVTAI